MNDPLKLAVALLAQRRNQTLIKLEECKLTWCFDLRWVEPSQADRVVEAAIEAGFLKEQKGGLKVTFPFDSIVIPTGFHPTLEELLAPLPRAQATPEPAQTASSSPSTPSEPSSTSTSPTTPPSEKEEPSKSSKGRPAKAVKSQEPLFPAIINAIQGDTGLSRREIISRVNRSQREHGLTDIEVEGLLEGARQGTELDRFYEPTSRLLRERYDDK